MASDTEKKTRSAAQSAHSRRARWLHGMRSRFAETLDETYLTDDERSRLAELREQMMADGGALGMLLDTVAWLGALADVGFQAWMARAEQDGPARAFEMESGGNVIKALVCFQRGLASLDRIGNGRDLPDSDIDSILARLMGNEADTGATHPLGG